MSYNPKQKALEKTYFQGEYVYNYGSYVPAIVLEPDPTPTPTPSNTPTKTPTPTPSGTRTTPTPTPTNTKTPTQTPTKTPTNTPTKTSTPSTIVYTYLGRTLVDQPDGVSACANYLSSRGYVGLKPLSALIVGNYIYDAYPASPTNGGNNWVALKVGGVGQGYAFQIDSTGQIIDTYTC